MGMLEDDMEGEMAKNNAFAARAKSSRDRMTKTINTSVINQICQSIHNDNVAAGWWTDIHTGEQLDRNMGELLCLVHSEISEAMEGHRKGLPDDKLPHRAMLEVELADACIRIFDIAGWLGLDLGGAIAEKRAFNATRADHKIENRLVVGGKAY